ncbi:MAG: ribonuclease E/G [Lachnospiraceae bacterium]
MYSEDGRIIIFSEESGITAFFLENGRIAGVWKEKKESVRVGDIYLGRISHYAANIDAYYIEVLKGINCFLPAGEILKTKTRGNAEQQKEKTPRLHVGDELLVQIKKEAYKKKLAYATTKLELAGKYSVVSNESAGVHYSKKIAHQDKERLISLMEKDIPESATDCRVLLRTVAAECQDFSPVLQEIREHANILQQITASASYTYPLRKVYGNRSLLELLFTEGRVRKETKIVTKDKEVFENITELCGKYGFDAKQQAILYPEDELPLSILYNLKSKLQEITEEKVWLPSGGSLYIAPTEALVVIDVNTGKCVLKGNSEDTFLKINLEASREIAFQIQARNLSGIILVDFINMKSENNATILLDDLRTRLRNCSPQGIVVDITKLGLVEITREKKRPDIYEIKNELNKTILM